MISFYITLNFVIEFRTLIIFNKEFQGVSTNQVRGYNDHCINYDRSFCSLFLEVTFFKNSGVHIRKDEGGGDSGILED